MKKCKYEKQIDPYLLKKLSEYETEEFERHYFNCHHCFKRLQEREELISVVKHKGHALFKDLIEAENFRPVSRIERFLNSLSPLHWAGAAASAAAILIIALGILPSMKSSSPQFYLDDDTTRGQSITLISDAIPTEFKWESLGNDVEYKISIYNHELLWEATTLETSLSLPLDVRDKMIPGITYFWQVKAYSPTGTLLAQSSKVKLPTIQE